MSEPSKKFKEKRSIGFSNHVSRICVPSSMTASDSRLWRWPNSVATSFTATPESRSGDPREAWGKSNSESTESSPKRSLRVQRLAPTMSKSTATTSYAAMWKNLDLKWLSTCAYHRDQAISISKAKGEGLFNTDEAMSELRLVREEREKCKECRV